MGYARIFARAVSNPGPPDYSSTSGPGLSGAAAAIKSGCFRSCRGQSPDIMTVRRDRARCSWPGQLSRRRFGRSRETQRRLLLLLHSYAASTGPKPGHEGQSIRQAASESSVMTRGCTPATPSEIAVKWRVGVGV